MKRISKMMILLMLLSITAFHPARVNAAQQQRLSAGIISISLEYQNKPVVVPNETTTVSSPDTEEIEEPNPAPVARIELSEDEYWLLCRCVEAEGGITTKPTKIAIAEVIINRVLSPNYPNNVPDVIYYQDAFEVVENGRIDQVTPTEETIEAVDIALHQKTYDDNLIAFRSDYYHSFGEDAFGKDNMFFSKE